jgi:diacylglycerol O-acyltransferase
MTTRPRRLSPLDASFLAVESDTAPMHVGWAAVFLPSSDAQRPTFERLRDHIAGRMGRAPRYRQRLAHLPFDVQHPVWVDDEHFSVERHVRRDASPDLAALAGAVMSEPLPADRPLWEIVIADRLADGRIGVIGKVHHCMVDGIAAVELAGLLLDPTPDAPATIAPAWRPAPARGDAALLADAARDLVDRQLGRLAAAWRTPRAPRDVVEVVRAARQAAGALAGSARPAPRSGLNIPLSCQRRLEIVERPLDDVRRAAASCGVSLNDVVLAATAGGVRRLMLARSEQAPALKTMVPVNVRDDGAESDLGNRISFMFVDLPCDIADPIERVRAVHRDTTRLKRAQAASGAATVLSLLALTPPPVQAVVSRLTASRRVFNLTVSNVPGPSEPLWMHGCRLDAAFPVIPLADDHGVSVGMTTIAGRACFGVYADPVAVPDAAVLAAGIEDDLDELSRAENPVPPRRTGRFTRSTDAAGVPAGD